MEKRVYVRDYMSAQLVTVTPDTEILHAVQKLLTYKVSGAPVVDDSGSLVGMLTERDCMKVVINAVYHSEYGGVVAEFMATEIQTMQADDNLVDAARRFFQEGFLRYPVMQEGRLIGVISRSDVMRAMGDFWDWKRDGNR
jgi:CBS domain-containing protein